MRPLLASPPASAPRPGQSMAVRVRTSLRRTVSLSIAGLLVVLLGPAGLAAPCAPRAATCPGGGCGAPDTTACPGCPAMAAAARALAGSSDLGSSGAAGCDCEVAPAKAPPAKLSAAEDATERFVSGGMLLSQAIGRAPEPVLAAVSGRVPGPPPEPGGPLYIRNRVLRV